jgi:hypothetical protein
MVSGIHIYTIHDRIILFAGNAGNQDEAYTNRISILKQSCRNVTLVLSTQTHKVSIQVMLLVSEYSSRDKCPELGCTDIFYVLISERKEISDISTN